MNTKSEFNAVEIYIGKFWGNKIVKVPTGHIMVLKQSQFVFNCHKSIIL